MRKFVWDAGTITVGFFVVESNRFAFATGEALMFAGTLDQADIHWPGYLRRIRGCDVRLGSAGYRLYFVRPLPGAPRVRENQVTRITDALTSESGDVLQLVGGALGNAAMVGSVVGHLVSLPGEFADERRGRANGDAVRERLERHRPR
ncbi:hypothetical protein [Bailinhaonella thermotolerans]|uniref:hypothetical protein n=1 Tax=Bailinhaonella thermotolerans TaxID=1070861 RepID=UPI00192A6527|nr:hypothetical protein [Bailinhaonella thermotolerans]